MNCKTDNLDLEACVPIIRNVKQDLAYGWRMEEIAVANEYELTLYKRNKQVHKTYQILPDADGDLLWEADAADFINGIMHYVMVPVNGNPEEWIRFTGKITSNEKI